MLQEVFARKRETEQLRTEKNSAVAQYYDKWGRITTRFENWTTPEYYEKSDQQMRLEAEEKRRHEEAVGRRERLRDLLAREKAAWEGELKEQLRTKSRPGIKASSAGKHDVDVLQRLNSSLGEQERRRKEIESKLYSRWRLGMTRDEMILESRSHHQAMAKLNWLDQQVEEQLERDRSEKELQALQMKRQTEQLREEEIALEARQSREREVAELKRLLEFHVVELKTREGDSRTLKDQTAGFKDIKLGLEIKQQEVLTIFGGRRTHGLPMHNLRRLKVMVLEHCQSVHEEIVADASQLTAIRTLLRGQLLSGKEERHFQLLAGRFEQELGEMRRDVENFTAMYDSEVKANLVKQQKVWRENGETRFRLLKNLLQELMEKCNILIACNSEEIMSLVKIKETHLNSIDELNRKLQAMNEGGGGVGRKTVDYVEEALPTLAPPTADSARPIYLSLGEQMEEMRLALPENSGGGLSDRRKDGSPRFGKKKVAWC